MTLWPSSFVAHRLASLAPDFFVREPDRFARRDWVKLLTGVTLVLMGVAMLVLPGPGIVAIALGVSLLHAPFQRRLVQWLARHHKVVVWLNEQRAVAGAPPFVFEVPRAPCRPRDP